MASEAGRALNAFKIVAKAGDKQKAEVQRILDGGGPVARKFMEAAEVADNKEQMQKLIELANNPNKVDAGLEYWVNALLSGPKTQAVNLMGNGLQTFWGLSNRVFTPIVGKAFGASETSLKEAEMALIKIDRMTGTN